MSFRWLTVLGTFLGLTSASGAADFRDLLEKSTFKDANGAELKYRLMKPAEVAPNQKYPLVIFLHGAGERGDDNNAQLVHGIKEFAKDENRQKYPCFLVAPQCPKGATWADFRRGTGAEVKPDATQPLRLTLELIDQLVKDQPIDTDRIYITGLSMGGYGTWHALALRPDFFAAAVPVCGGADLKSADKIKSVPIWVFHGDKDNAVPVARSREMVEALKKAGGEPKYTEYPGVGHNSWDKAYADPEMFAWLFAQKRKKS
jgi:predicted peptidase